MSTDDDGLGELDGINWMMRTGDDGLAEKTLTELEFIGAVKVIATSLAYKLSRETQVATNEGVVMGLAAIKRELETVMRNSADEHADNRTSGRVQLARALTDYIDRAIGEVNELIERINNHWDGLTGGAADEIPAGD